MYTIIYTFSVGIGLYYIIYCNAFEKLFLFKIKFKLVLAQLNKFEIFLN